MITANNYGTYFIGKCARNKQVDHDLVGGGKMCNLCGCKLQVSLLYHYRSKITLDSYITDYNLIIRHTVSILARFQLTLLLSAELKHQMKTLQNTKIITFVEIRLSRLYADIVFLISHPLSTHYQQLLLHL